MIYNKENVIQKAKINRFFKYSGKLYNYSLNEKGMLELILYKGNKKECKILVLTSFNKELNKNVLEMIEKGCIKRFSIRFDVICKNYNGKYYTNLVLKECNEWKTTKKVIQEYINDNQSNIKIDWSARDLI